MKSIRKMKPYVTAQYSLLVVYVFIQLRIIQKIDKKKRKRVGQSSYKVIRNKRKAIMSNNELQSNL
jgi:5-carboxymethyl-2-hydroxymuconate isomerase